MSEEKIREIFARNLNKYLEASNRQPADIVRDLNIPFSTVSNWVNGLKLPRMGKVELLAQYFGVEKSDLLEEKKDGTPAYYLNDDARDAAEFLLHHPEYKVLFDASRKVKKEDIDFVAAMLERMNH